MKYLFLFLFSTALFAVKPFLAYANNINIYENANKKQITTYLVKQNNKEIGRFRAYNIKVVKKSAKYVVFRAFKERSKSGEIKFYILSLKSKKAKLKTIVLHTYKIMRKDFDNDGVKEFVFYDCNYEFLYGLCSACSPAVKVIADLKDGKFILQPKLMQKYMQPKIKHPHPSYVKINETGNLEIDHRYSPAIIKQVLFNIYVGRNIQATKLIKKYFKFQNRAQIVLFLQELTDAVSDSIFWDQIRALNKWQWETACFTKDCTPPIEYYDNPDIVSKLFKGVTKK